MSDVPPYRVTRVAATAAALACLACLLATCGVAPSGPAASQAATARASVGGPSGSMPQAAASAPATATPASSPPPHSPGDSALAASASPGAATATPSGGVRGHLALLETSSGPSRLRVVGPDGAIDDVAPPPPSALAIAAGPDGRLVARDARGLLWLAAGPPTPGGVSRADLAWSPLAPRLAAQPTLPGSIAGITWDRDGMRLLALAADLGGADDRIGLVAIRAIDGASAATIVRARPGGSLAWSLADGRRAFVARTRSDQAVVATTSGESVVLLDVRAYEIAFSGDRSVAAILTPDGRVRTGAAQDLLAGRIEGAAAVPPEGTEAVGFALDGTGMQLAVAWRSVNDAGGTLIAYRASGGAWEPALRLPMAATAETAVPAWLP